MLKIIEDGELIAKCQRQLVRGFKPFTGERLQVRLGHPGASFRARILQSEDLGIWIYSSKTAESRYWNAFGIIQGRDAAPLSITCEINFPFRGIDRRIGGAFAKDRDGRIFVVHRGRIGGKRGIGKSFFEEHYRGVWTLMEDGDAETAVALIGALKSPRFARQVSQFVRKVDGIKRNAVVSSSQMEIFTEITLREEFLGTGPEGLKRELASQCDHDLVVSDLSKRLIEMGLKPGNDGKRELFALDRAGRICVLFAVGTDLSIEVIHSGAARLMLNGIDPTGNPFLFLVLPGRPEAALEEQLRRLHIIILTYEWAGDRAIFPGMDALLYEAR